MWAFFFFPLVSVSCGYSVVAVCGILAAVASLTVERIPEYRLSGCGTMALVDLQHVASSWTRDRTRVSCTGRQIRSLPEF